MSLPIFVVDAFTAEPFRGNPAAIVLGDGSESWMQQLAAEMKHSETAFIRERSDGEYDLRWFTPEVEVDLCGHATLASAHVLWETAHIVRPVFHTRSGPLPAEHNDDGTITLDFPIETPVPAEPVPELFDVLGIQPMEFLRIEGDWYLCVVDDATIVRKLDPDFTRMRALERVRGVYVSAAGDDGYDIVSRCFGPGVGIDEDAVTGSMHCVLLAYWETRLGKSELRAFQASPRGGEMTVARAGDRARLTGRAVTVLRGDVST
jgi:PhzF family phenazine biosynthesis protein